MEASGIGSLLPAEPTLEDAGNDQVVLDLMLKAREKLQEAFDLSQTDGWDSVKEGKGISLWKKKESDSNINILKRSMEVNASIEKVLEFYRDPEGLMKVNDKVKANEIVVDINENTKIMRREIKGNLVVSNRDLSILWHQITLTDGSVAIVMFSIEHDKVPETKCVRASLDIGLLHLSKVSDTSTDLLSVLRLNPKGSVPAMLVNKMSKKQYDEFEAVKKLMEA
uniref:START domain-containing protein n=1 Tax=Euplotes harpa TaxID=151035 RepID=A0A7S3NC28_9SPIT|mmetsp:Transcript_6019/g.6989  ORF Transcript_6019/g.6989 Transcript_6019/m.6989 type:complete len:224 (+) Transcript_6019:21-692(+)